MYQINGQSLIHNNNTLLLDQY